MYENALDEWASSPGPKSPLPADMIGRIRDQETNQKREERQQRMIDHGDVDPDYFNR